MSPELERILQDAKNQAVLNRDGYQRMLVEENNREAIAKRNLERLIAEMQLRHGPGAVVPDFFVTDFNDTIASVNTNREDLQRNINSCTALIIEIDSMLGES